MHLPALSTCCILTRFVLGCCPGAVVALSCPHAGVVVSLLPLSPLFPLLFRSCCCCFAVEPLPLCNTFCGGPQVSVSSVESTSVTPKPRPAPIQVPTVRPATAVRPLECTHAVTQSLFTSVIVWTSRALAGMFHAVPGWSAPRYPVRGGHCMQHCSWQCCAHAWSLTAEVLIGWLCAFGPPPLFNNGQSVDREPPATLSPSIEPASR